MSMHSNKQDGPRGSELLYAFGITSYLLSKSSFGRRTGKLNVQHTFVRRTTITSERSSLPRFLAFAATGLLLAPLPAEAKPKAAPVQTAVIENTGSTNTMGYKITVMLTGDLVKGTAVENGGNEYRAEISNNGALKKQVQQFVVDLNAAMPLTSLPVRHGMRSASFGTQTYITYKGQRSPDLTFASDPRTVALKADIDSITKALHVGNAPRRPIVIHVHADR